MAAFKVGDGPVIRLKAPFILPEGEMRAQVAAHRWPYYVYALCSASGRIFYIGKGTRDRMFAHAKEASEGGRSAKCQVIRLLGADLRYSLLAVCADEAFALGLEAFHINDTFGCTTNLKRGAVEDIARMFDAPSPIDIALRLAGEVRETLRRMQLDIESSIKACVRKHPHTAVLFGVTHGCT